MNQNRNRFEESALSCCGIDIPEEKIAEFCRKWKITELALRTKQVVYAA